MKWLGWAFFVIVVIVRIGLHEGEVKEIALERKRVDDIIAEKTSEVEAVISNMERGVPPLRKRLKEEAAKLKKYEEDKAQAIAKREAIEKRIEELHAAVERQQDAKDNVKVERSQNIAEIQKLQKQITTSEAIVAKLVQRLESVTEKTGM